MEIVYEVRDVTDEDVYYPLGLFSDLEKAKVFCTKARNTGSPPHSEWTELDMVDDRVDLKIVARPLDKWTEHSAHIVSFKWTATYDDDDPVWTCRERGAE